MRTDGDSEFRVSRKSILAWVAGIASTLTVTLILGFATWLTSMHNQMAIFETRITVLERQGANQKEQLEKIDQKLDRVIELMQRRAGGN